MSRMTWRGRRVVVTGASSGIGRALAVAFAERGCELILTARRAERLAEVREACLPTSDQVLVVPGDISSDETRRRIRELVEQTWGGLDLLVNNAGVGARGAFQQASSERLRRLMEVNFFAPLELIRILLPKLASGTRPQIVNIGSVLGHRAVPDKSEYSASKFALHGFSDALRAELVSQGIHVLLVSPSTTESEFSEHLLDDQADKKVWGKAMSSTEVATRTIRAIERRRNEVILSWGGQTLVWLDRLAPTLADWLVARFR